MKRPVSYLSSKAGVREGEGGLEAYALEPIPCGQTVAAFGGWVLSLKELRAIGGAAVYRSVQIDDDLYLAPVDADGPGDMINHSCDPTCGILGSQLLVARRDVATGENLTFDYATTDSSDYDEFQCACGSLLCRGRITGNDWKDPVLQERHRGWFSAYLQRRLEKA